MVMLWKAVFNNIMVHHTMKQYIHFATQKDHHKGAVYVPEIKRWIYCVETPQSISELCRAIQDPDVHRPDGNPRKVHRDTVYAHVDDLEKKYIMEKLRKTRSFRHIFKRSHEFKTSNPPQRLQRQLRKWNRTLYRPNILQLYHYLDYVLTVLTRDKLGKEEKDKVVLKVLGLPCPPFLIKRENSGLVIYQ
jgi:hypothetical protein